MYSLQVAAESAGSTLRIILVILLYLMIITSYISLLMLVSQSRKANWRLERIQKALESNFPGMLADGENAGKGGERLDYLL